MTAKQRDARNAELKTAMLNLVQNVHFQQFMDLLKDHREASVRDACSDAVVKCQRSSLSAVGEIKTYTYILDTYQEFIDQAEAGRIQEHSMQ